MWMNEVDIETTAECFSKEETPNLHAGSMALWRLMNWVNRNSDGWPYWAPPSRASESLQKVLGDKSREYFRGGSPTDITKTELTGLLRPIKAFLTRQKGWDTEAAHEAVFPTPPSPEELRRGALRELVHDTASQIAADALNSGDGEEFLLTNGWSQEEIEDHLARRIKENS